MIVQSVYFWCNDNCKHEELQYQLSKRRSTERTSAVTYAWTEHFLRRPCRAYSVMGGGGGGGGTRLKLTSACLFVESTTSTELESSGMGL